MQELEAQPEARARPRDRRRYRVVLSVGEAVPGLHAAQETASRRVTVWSAALRPQPRRLSVTRCAVRTPDVLTDRPGVGTLLFDNLEAARETQNPPPHKRGSFAEGGANTNCEQVCG